ncbi:MAG: sugar ABC transporter ATP-binding protein [Hyphomicrobiales bacterium]|nr:sugar ABC transporter ATP-binding protein [Hyphomicrobiales bacterium]
MDSDGPTLEMKNIMKAFPGVVALDGVSFRCNAGEVHALAGENGAGKSTLIKILSGAYQPDSGTLEINGKQVTFPHPVKALNAGISVIYQEFALLPYRTVAQNIFLGHEPRRRCLVDSTRMNDETAKILRLFGDSHGIDPDDVVDGLNVSQQQMVEIAKAIAFDARIVVMDEPTAALNEQESEVLFALVDKLRSQARAIVYITHRLREISRLANRVTILKDGKVAAHHESVPDPDVIIHDMVGRDIGDFYPAAAAPDEIGAPVLSVRNGANSVLKSIDLDLKGGEIVGIAGLQGAGRAALAKALFGAEPFTEGEMRLKGAEMPVNHPRDAASAGIVMLPGDRKAEGLLLMQSVTDNGMIASRAFSSFVADHRRNRYSDTDKMADLFRQLDVRAASFDQEARFLSGGNQQKCIVARWLSLSPDVLIFVEPTRGIDVNTKASIYDLMRQLARRGAAIMMISSDLPEVIGVSDRIVVMREGAIAVELPRGASEADVIHAATFGTVVQEVA